MFHIVFTFRLKRLYIDNMHILDLFCYPENASRLMLASWSLQVCFFEIKQCFSLVGLKKVICCSEAVSDVFNLLHGSLQMFVLYLLTGQTK